MPRALQALDEAVRAGDQVLPRDEHPVHVDQVVL